MNRPRQAWTGQRGCNKKRNSVVLRGNFLVVVRWYIAWIGVRKSRQHGEQYDMGNIVINGWANFNNNLHKRIFLHSRLGNCVVLVLQWRLASWSVSLSLYLLVAWQVRLMKKFVYGFLHPIPTTTAAGAVAAWSLLSDPERRSNSNDRYEDDINWIGMRQSVPRWCYYYYWWNGQPARAWVNKSTVHEAMNTDKW